MEADTGRSKDSQNCYQSAVHVNRGRTTRSLLGQSGQPRSRWPPPRITLAMLRALRRTEYPDVAPHMLVALLRLTDPLGYRVPVDCYLAFAPSNLQNRPIAGELRNQIMAEEQQSSMPGFLRAEGG